MTRRNKTILYIVLALCLAISVVFGIPQLKLLHDETANGLLLEILSRTGLAAFLVCLFVGFGFKHILCPTKFGFGRAVLWCLPCLAVAIVNFPFSALVNGTATVTYPKLLPLFILSCILIGITEELLFRGLLHDSLKHFFMKYRCGYIYAVLLSSAIFALWHLVNLFFGQSIGATLLQVGYTFLLGAMFAVTLDKTKNIWLCVIVHALFDVGGTIVTDLGSGHFQDLTFWILTAIAGVVCAVHIILSLKQIIIERSSTQTQSEEK